MIPFDVRLFDKYHCEDILNALFKLRVSEDADEDDSESESDLSSNYDSESESDDEDLKGYIPKYSCTFLDMLATTLTEELDVRKIPIEYTELEKDKEITDIISSI